MLRTLVAASLSTPVFYPMGRFVPFFMEEK